MPIVTTGPSGGAPNRLEINEFVKHEKFFSLYIQALHLLQTKGTQDDPDSFFQIAGIHGLPFSDWDGVKGNFPGDPSWESGGYCTHGSVLFPTWHRPYVALYEQMIQKFAKEVAATYGVDQPAWMRAAEELRQPYWDWAANAIPPDEIIALPAVAIIAPEGRRIYVRNPLYSYSFNPTESSFPNEFRNCKETMRWPTSSEVSATHNVALLKAILAANQADITINTYNMLTRTHTWQAFSNHTVGDDDSTSNSLEAIHDSVHFFVGGVNGHMSSVLVAGFDPIFFLHHCNVDRLLSLWSALNPTVWVSPGDSDHGTWTIPLHSQINDSTPLTPFRNSSNTFWASSGIQDTGKLGYSYPEFNGLDLNNRPAVFRAIGEVVNKLYGNVVLPDLPSPTLVTPTLASAPSSSAHEEHASLRYQFHDWTACIEAKKYEAETSFGVFLFFGDPPEDPIQWNLCDNFVGSYAAFVNSKADQCANCVSQANPVIQGFIHLNHAITRLSGLRSLEPEAVEPYLTEKLNWRVMRVDGEAIDLRSLDVSIYGTLMSFPSGAMFPTIDHRRRCFNITHGRSASGSSRP